MRLPPDFLYTLPSPLIFAVILGVVASVALSVNAVFGRNAGKHAGAEFSKINTGVVSVSGAVFGLSMTFLANAVWNTQDQANDTLNAEARAIRVMDVYMDSLTGPERDGLAKLLADYGRAVAVEWDAMGTEGEDMAAEYALRNLYGAVIKGLAQGDQNRTLQQRLLPALDAISAARQQRLSIAQNYVSGSQWLLVTGLALVLLCIVGGSHADFPLARRTSLTGLSLAISILLFVIVLHDRPFTGYDALTPEPILAAAGALP
jgi:hypothetical protein